MKGKVWTGGVGVLHDDIHIRHTIFWIQGEREKEKLDPGFRTLPPQQRAIGSKVLLLGIDSGTQGCRQVIPLTI